MVTKMRLALGLQMVPVLSGVVVGPGPTMNINKNNYLYIFI